MIHEPCSAPANPQGCRVLLVEDNEAACKGLARLLQAQGFAVTSVQNGASALEALAAGAPPDFLLTDLQLPDMDGRDVARHARHLVPPPRVALITGWDLEPEAADPSSSGIDWVLTKPLNIHELIGKLRETLHAVPSPTSAEPPKGDGVPNETPGVSA